MLVSLNFRHKTNIFFEGRGGESAIWGKTSLVGQETPKLKVQVPVMSSRRTKKLVFLKIKHRKIRSSHCQVIKHTMQMLLVSFVCEVPEKSGCERLSV